MSIPFPSQNEGDMFGKKGVGDEESVCVFRRAELASHVLGIAMTSRNKGPGAVPMACRIILCCLLACAAAVADERELAPMMEICGEVAKQLRDGDKISALHLEKIRKLQDGPARLTRIAIDPGVDCELRMAAVRLLEALEAAAAVNSLLPIALDVKEAFRIRKQVLDTAAALKLAALPEFLITMVEKKADGGLYVWSRFSSLDVDQKSSAFEHLFDLLRHQETEIRLHALQFLAAVRHPAAAPHLELLIEDNLPEVRAWAILAMAFQGRNDHIRHLKKALEDPSPLVKSKAVTGLSYPPYCKETGAKKIMLIFADEIQKLSGWREEAAKARQIWEDWDARGKKLRERGARARKEERARIEEDLQKIGLELDHARMDYFALRQKSVDQERLLVSIVLALPRFDPEKKPGQPLEFLLSLLDHEVGAISEAALFALAGVDRLRTSPSMPVVIPALIAHWQRVQANPSLVKRLHQLLLDVTGAKDIAPSAKAWKKWWEQIGKRQHQ